MENGDLGDEPLFISFSCVSFPLFHRIFRAYVSVKTKPLIVWNPNILNFSCYTRVPDKLSYKLEVSCSLLLPFLLLVVQKEGSVLPKTDINIFIHRVSHWDRSWQLMSKGCSALWSTYEVFNGSRIMITNNSKRTCIQRGGCGLWAWRDGVTKRTWAANTG